MQKQSVNQFTELNSDSHPVNTKNTVMTDAINATLTTRGENQLILQNMEGNHQITGLTEGFQPLGVEVYNDIAYIISGRFDDQGKFIEGEIGTYPSPRWGNLLTNGLDPDYYLNLKDEYSPLHNFSSLSTSILLGDDNNYIEPFRTEKLNFLSDRLIEIECQSSYDGSVNIIFTDNYNYPRLINSRFKLSEDGKRAAIADRRQNKDTNTYAENRWEQTRLIKVTDKILDLTFDGVIPGGKNPSGGYKYYFKYVDADGALTDIVEESGLVTLSYDDYGSRVNELPSKSVKFTLSNLDRTFSSVKVYFSRSTSDEVAGTSEIYEVIDLFDIPNAGPMEIVITGYETLNLINEATLNLTYSDIHKVRTLSQQDDRLVLGNITTVVDNYEEFRDIAQKITLEEKERSLDIITEGGGYADPNNVYYNLGYWAGETYEFAIVFILKEGKGLTPAFPIRGGDNYENTFNYTSGTPVITTDDGYITGSSENRLGAYRTYKCRNLFDGALNTQIKYFTANMTSIYSQATSISDGFFFVRRDRRKDCVQSGYMCNTVSQHLAGYNILAGSNLTDPNDETTHQDYISIGQLGNLNFNTEHYIPIRTESGWSGPNFRAILPAPGRITETTVVDVAPNGTQIQAVKGDGLGTQGKVSPDPKVYPWTGKKYYSYYSADNLCDPKVAASFFDGSRKGLVVNDADQVVMAYEEVVPGATTSTIIPPRAWTGLFSNNPQIGSYTYTFNGGHRIKFRPVSFELEEDQTSSAYDWNGKIVIAIQVENSLGTNSLGDFNQTYDIRITTSGIIQGQPFLTAITNENDFVSTQGALVEHENYTQLAANNSYLNMGTISSYNGVASDFSVLPWNITDNLQGEVKRGGTNNYYDLNDANFSGELDGLNPSSVVDTTPPITIGINLTQTQKTTARRPVNVLNYGPFSFCPNVIPKDNKVSGSYVPEGRRAYSNDSFSSVEPGATYTWLTSNRLTTGLDDLSDNQNTSLIGVNYTSHEEYVGVAMEVGSTLLGDPLQNDDLNVFSEEVFLSNGYGYTGNDITDWVNKLQFDGIRFGVVSKFYTSADGPLSANNWKSVYNNSGVTGNYKQVSKRMRWDQLSSVGDKTLDLYGGDCYIANAYKRAMKPLGIEGIPTATDPEDYTTANQDAGLSAKGFVFPLIHESNHNAALRTREEESSVNKKIFGGDKTFYPVTPIDEIRSLKQEESKGYNFGYDFTTDKIYTQTNDRAPILNTEMHNRVMVSKPSIDNNFKNGYTDFSGLNFRDYNRQLGEITKLISHNNMLYCVFESGVGIVPMNQRTMVSQATGGVFLDDAQVLASKMQIISSEYGSDQQFSIIKTDGYVYGVDINKNKVWRIGQAGLEIISDFAVQSILNVYKDRLDKSGQNNYVVTNYDRTRNNVIFSFFTNYEGKFNTDCYTTVIDDTPIVPTGPLDVIVTTDEKEDNNFVLPGNTNVDINIKGNNNDDNTVNTLEEINTNEIDTSSTRPIGSVNTTDSNKEVSSDTISTKSSVINAEDLLKEEESKKQDKLNSFQLYQTLEDPLNSTEGNQSDATGQKINFEGKGIPSEDLPIIPEPDPFTGELIPVLVEEDCMGTIYFNETINKWVSQLSWNPLFTFNLSNDLYSFNGVDNYSDLWKHFSKKVPYCNFYGKQEKFEFEFVIVENSSVQKILNNLIMITNDIFPGRVVYSLESDRDFDSLVLHNDSYIDMLKQRHEYIETDTNLVVHWTMNQTVINGFSYMDFNISKEEADRIEGGYFVYNNNFYILGANVVQNDTVYVQILDDQSNPLSSLPVGITFNRIEFGIIRQNIEYREDHMYIEVGKNIERSRIRDKAIRVRMVYEGQYHAMIQSIISLFVYSHN